MMMPEDVYPYAPSQNGNPIDNTYEGLKSQDDGAVWNTNYEEDDDDGFWYNSVAKPHYELPNARRVKMMEKILNAKHFNRQPNADMFY
jgi:hypothetical protein